MLNPKSPEIEPALIPFGVFELDGLHGIAADAGFCMRPILHQLVANLHTARLVGEAGDLEDAETPFAGVEQPRRGSFAGD